MSHCSEPRLRFRLNQTLKGGNPRFVQLWQSFGCLIGSLLGLKVTGDYQGQTMSQCPQMTDFVLHFHVNPLCIVLKVRHCFILQSVGALIDSVTFTPLSGCFL